MNQVRDSVAGAILAAGYGRGLRRDGNKLRCALAGQIFSVLATAELLTGKERGVITGAAQAGLRIQHDLNRHRR